MADTLVNAAPSPLRFHLVSFRTAPSPPYHPYRRPASELPFSCTLCGTAYTPLRRAGPRGRNTLCNACGLQWARRERVRRETSPQAVSAPSSPQQSAPSSPELAVVARKTPEKVTPPPQSSKMAIAALLN